MKMKVLALTFVIAIAALAVSAMTIGVQNKNVMATDASTAGESVAIEMKSRPEQLLANGGQAAVAVTTADTDINAARGSTVKASFTLTYQPGVMPPDRLTVVSQGIWGKLLPPSVATAKAPQEIFDELQTTGAIAGSIDLTPLVRFQPGAVILTPGESKTVDMYITIPQNWPDEMVGKTVDFSPKFSILEQDGTKQIGLYNSITTVHVVS